MPTIVRVKAFETDTVEIAWGLKDGTWFVQRVTIPPKSTREVRSLDVVGQPLERGGKATTEVVQPQKGSPESVTVEGLASTEKVRITVYRLIGESPEAFQMRVEQERVVAHWRANQMQYVPCVRPPEPGLGNVYGGSPYGEIDWR